jgi:hypothetical protein
MPFSTMPRPEFEGRFTTIYFSTKDELTHWKDLATARGVSLPDLISSALESLEKSLNAAPRPDLTSEMEDLKGEVDRLSRELRLQGDLVQHYESELYRVRHADFREVNPSGQSDRAFDLELIRALKGAHRAMNSGAIIAALRIDPGDQEAVKLVRNQLDSLSRYGLISESSHGWSWKK